MRRDEQDTADHNRLAPDVSGEDPWMRVMDRGLLFMLPWALHGWRWYEIDVSGYVIRLLARLRLIRQVVRGTVREYT